ncbi:MAG: FkbM family methyltransferase [Aestuariivita sp.]|nr:FkbM family methyltransferase [Aestuariivita sp.]MCY4345160.1 FkbM family methyltransferase [Aestuariivita sp.]
MSANKLSRLLARFVVKMLLPHLEKGDRTVRAVFIDDYVSRKILLDGLYEKQELNLLRKEVFCKLPKDSTVIDIGANIGNHSNYFFDHFVSVIAVEPNPMVADILSANVKYLLDSHDHEMRPVVQVVNVALSNTSGKLGFKVNHSNLGKSEITDNSTDMKVDVMTLDLLSSELRTREISFIKIDVEGHEENVLDGGTGLLSNSSPIIALEGFYEDDPEKGNRVEELLRSMGYKFFYRQTYKKFGESSTFYNMMPKFIRRFRDLRLEEVSSLSGENFAMAICSKFDITKAPNVR